MLLGPCLGFVASALAMWVRARRVPHGGRAHGRSARARATGPLSPPAVRPAPDEPPPAPDLERAAVADAVDRR
jgi:hypothetical protein